LKILRSFIEALLPALDFLLSPVTLVAALWMKAVRRAGIQRLPASRRVFRAAGIYPIRDHYHDPYTDALRLKRPLSEPRDLPGIDWNLREQLELLGRFHWNDELLAFPFDRAGRFEFHYANGSFEPGDAEFLYNTIRHARPRRLIEIGCGNSTLMALAAERKNAAEPAGHACEHLCIEPYEQPWLERLPGVTVLREKVEDVSREVFARLEAGDILFIDSSHVLRPQGDVVFEFLEVLPLLRSGVLVHVHDIFSPRDYPREWIEVQGRMYDEQYLLEAFLSHNRDFRVIGALNLLKHDHFARLAEKCPVLKAHPDHEPGSFWMVRS